MDYQRHLSTWAPLSADNFFSKAIGDLITRGRLEEAPASATSPHSGFGGQQNLILELRNWSIGPFVPGDIQLENSIRGASHFRSLGMACWNLRGSSLVRDVEPYNNRASTFSDDGNSIRAPWGVRLLSPEPKSHIISNLLNLLAADPATLRGCLPAYLPQDVGVRSRDVPCLLTIVACIREGCLHVIAIFRALNAYAVLPYDHAFLVIFSEILRAHLGVSTMTLAYQVVSLHVGDSQVEAAKAALGAVPGPKPEPLAYRLPDGDIFTELAILERTEPQLRSRYAAGESGVDILRPLRRSHSWAATLLDDLDNAYRSEYLEETIPSAAGPTEP